MAESESGADKSEEPTEKRLRESREEGQIARSRELNTFAILLAGTGGMLAFGADIAQMCLTIMKSNFSLSREMLMDERMMGIGLIASGKLALQATMPLLLVMLVAAFIGGIGLGGFNFSGKMLAPKFSRMNPGAGLKRMFSQHALVELLKALGKFGLVLVIGIAVLKSDQEDLLAIAKEPIEAAILHSIEIVGWSSLLMGCSLALIAAIDVPFQLYDNKQKLMMTKQEIRDEYKESEGKPEVKAKIRQMQRQASQRKMMQKVPEADVVITNPTHFAIALKYDAATGGAPVVLAKGGDFLAFKIREVAQENNVMLLESAALARSIYFSTELDQEIPAGLYLAVAQVLAYVYQLRQFHAGKGRRPQPLKDLPIPPDLRKNAEGTAE